MARGMTILAFAFAAMLLMGAGCMREKATPSPNQSQAMNQNNIANLDQNQTSGSKPAEKTVAVCGNGKLETGENSLTCCPDAGCPNGQICQTGATENYACAMISKSDTAQAKQIEMDYLKMRDDMQTWVDANRTSSVGTDPLFLPLQDMEVQINALEAAGYDARAERALMTILDTAYHDQVELEARRHSAQARMAQVIGAARDRYLNAISLSLEEVQNAISDAKIDRTRLLKAWDADKAARQQAIEQYGLDENLWQMPAQEQAMLQELESSLTAEQTQLSPHNRNEWVQSGDMRIRLGGLSHASCIQTENTASRDYLVIPVEVENQGSQEISFGPSAFRVRDWYKNQYSVSTPLINSTSVDCVDYYNNNAGLLQQKLLPGSRGSGQVWADIRGNYSAFPWEIYADMPNGEQIVWSITP